MEKLLSKIETRLKYLENNSENAFMKKYVNILREKMKYMAERTYTTQEVVDSACDSMINKDLTMMRGVPGQTNMVYKKIDELQGFIEEIKTTYFEED